MIYKLFNEPTPTYGPITQILVNRGFDADNLLPWINAKYPDSINSPAAFGRDAVIRAVEFLHEALVNESRICVIVDADCDGFSSGAIIFNFLVAIGVKLDNISYILHTGKQHGLADTIDRIPQDTDLVVIPDAGTNDVDQMQELVDNGKKILCADHHEADNYLKNNNVVIINNQISDYPNKDLAGAGVMWQVCRYYDSVYGTDEAYSLIDLAALGCCGDMMNFQSIETKAIIQEGFNHIKNPFFYYMVEKNSFSINKMGGINYMSIAFYVVPFINAIVRSGTMEEKDLVFKSMLQAYAFEKIESGKRGHKGELVPRVEEGIRIAANVKARQTKLQDAAMTLLEQRIADEHLTDNAIILLLCQPGEVERNLAGLCANKIQAKYQRPCYILTKSKEKDDKEYFYRGSGRNYSMSENQDLRQLVLSTGLLEWAQGHANAHGCSISENHINDFINATNELYKNIAKEPVYWIDYVWTKDSVSPNAVLTIGQHKELWGQGIPESLVCVRDIPLSSVDIQLLSKDKHPTIKIHLNNGVDIMKFGSSEEEFESFLSPNAVLTIVGKCGVNEWMGRVTPQILVQDFTLREEWIF